MASDDDGGAAAAEALENANNIRCLELAMDGLRAVCYTRTGLQECRNKTCRRKCYIP